MDKNMYIINALSNMHVGSGDVNFGVIDNLIQRDVITLLPNINSSGLKGAIREFFKNYYNEDNKAEFIKSVFGSEPKETDSDEGGTDEEKDNNANNTGNKSKKKKSNQQGAFRFFEANLLSIPVRSNCIPFFMATSIHIVKELLYKADNFGINLGEFETSLRDLAILSVEKNRPIVFNHNYEYKEDDNDDERVYIEEHSWKSIFKENNQLEMLERFFGAPLILLNDKDFSSVCDNNNLPVIARNNLENGQSQNLWYEQILPRFSKLYFTLIKEQPVKPIDDLFEIFDRNIENNVIQIGANATIGYGYCRIKNINNI